ncbi:MAG: hypothetical protein ACWGOX_03100 [Desulforhopalus sp.]
MKSLPVIPLLFGTLLLLAISHPCYGHKVRIFAWEEGPDIVTESKFSGGRAARNVTVSVVDSATGEQLLSGNTDDQGMFRFAKPQTEAPSLEIIVDGGDGHKGSWEHTLEEPPPDSSPRPAATGNKTLPVEGQPEAGIPAATAAPLQTVDTEQLAILIEGIMEKKLAPIRRQLAENAEKGPSLQDILGGLGYIFGLAGIGAYFRFKKNKE